MDPGGRVLKGTPHPRDANVVFDDPSHTYTVHGVTYTGSATGFLGLFFGNFDPVATSIRCAAKGASDPTYKYAGMTAQEIRDKWEAYGNERAAAGTECHANIENYLKGRAHNTTMLGFRPFLEFHSDVTRSGLWVPWDAEWSIYNDVVKLAGQIDMVYANAEDAAEWHAWEAAGGRAAGRAPPRLRLWLVDWKFSKPLEETGFRGAMARGPCATLPDTNLYKYHMQLNTYQWIVESNYNCIVERRTIVRFPPEGGFERYDIPKKQRMLRKMLAYREAVRAAEASNADPPSLDTWVPSEYTGGEEEEGGADGDRGVVPTAADTPPPRRRRARRFV